MITSVQWQKKLKQKSDFQISYVINFSSIPTKTFFFLEPTSLDELINLFHH